MLAWPRPIGGQQHAVCITGTGRGQGWWARSKRHPAPCRPSPAHPFQPKVVVINIGTNDLTNCGWSIKDRTLKERALDQQLPGILQR